MISRKVHAYRDEWNSRAPNALRLPQSGSLLRLGIRVPLKDRRLPANLIWSSRFFVITLFLALF